MKNRLKATLCILSSFFLINSYAADPAAIPETTPPAAEGPLTVDQILPIQSNGKALKPIPKGLVPATLNVPATSSTTPAPETSVSTPRTITPLPAPISQPTTTISTPGGRVSTTPLLPQAQPNPPLPGPTTTTPPAPLTAQ